MLRARQRLYPRDHFRRGCADRNQYTSGHVAAAQFVEPSFLRAHALAEQTVIEQFAHL